MKQRKVGKHHVVTMLPDFKEGQTVTVARLDARTVLVSLESPDRVCELAALFPRQESSPWDAAMSHLAGRPNSGQGRRMWRRAGETERDHAVSDEEALAFATRPRPRRTVR